MYHCVYTNLKANQRYVMEHVSKGLSVSPVDLVNFNLEQIPASDVVVFIGLIHGMGDLYRNILRRNQPYWYLDHAYFNAGYEGGWQRCTANEFVQNKIKTKALSRPAFSQKQLDIRLSGDYILGIPSTDSVDYVFGDAHNWYTLTCQKVSELLDLPIVHRYKDPLIKLDHKGRIVKRVRVKNKSSVEEQIMGARCLVTYSSSVSIQARLLGCPVLVHERNAAYPVSETLDTILNPLPRDLGPWLTSLSNSQFTLEEFSSGIIDRL